MTVEEIYLLLKHNTYGSGKFSPKLVFVVIIPKNQKIAVIRVITACCPVLPGYFISLPRISKRQIFHLNGRMAMPDFLQYKSMMNQRNFFIRLFQPTVLSYCRILVMFSPEILNIFLIRHREALHRLSLHCKLRSKNALKIIVYHFSFDTSV